VTLGDLVRALVGEGACDRTIEAAVRAAQSRTARFAQLYRELASAGVDRALIARAVELADQARDHRMAEQAALQQAFHETLETGAHAQGSLPMGFAAGQEKWRNPATIRTQRRRERLKAVQRIEARLSVSGVSLKPFPHTPNQDITHTHTHTHEASDEETGVAAMLAKWRSHQGDGRGSLFPQHGPITAGAYADAARAIRQYGLDECVKLIDRAAASPLVTGQTQSGIRMSFAALIKPDNLGRLANGEYNQVRERELPLVGVVRTEPGPAPAADGADAAPPAEVRRVIAAATAVVSTERFPSGSLRWGSSALGDKLLAVARAAAPGLDPDYLAETFRDRLGIGVYGLKPAEALRRFEGWCRGFAERRRA